MQGATSRQFESNRGNTKRLLIIGIIYQFNVRVGVGGNHPDRQIIFYEYEVAIDHAQTIRSDSHEMIIPSAHAPRM